MHPARVEKDIPAITVNPGHTMTQSQSQPESRYSVLVITDPKTHAVLLTKRAAHMRTHPGELCFPGGKIELGEHPVETALRESFEEIGLCKDYVRIIEPEPQWLTTATTYTTGKTFAVIYAELECSMADFFDLLDFNLDEVVSAHWFYPDRSVIRELVDDTGVVRVIPDAQTPDIEAVGATADVLAAVLGHTPSATYSPTTNTTHTKETPTMPATYRPSDLRDIYSTATNIIRGTTTPKNITQKQLSALANYTFDHIETPKPTIAQTGWKPDTHTLREAMWEDENTTVVMLDCVSGYVTCYIPDTGQIEHVKDIDIVPSDTQYSVVKSNDDNVEHTALA